FFVRTHHHATAAGAQFVDPAAELCTRTACQCPTQVQQSCRSDWPIALAARDAADIDVQPIDIGGQGSFVAGWDGGEGGGDTRQTIEPLSILARVGADGGGITSCDDGSG